MKTITLILSIVIYSMIIPGKAVAGDEDKLKLSFSNPEEPGFLKIEMINGNVNIQSTNNDINVFTQAKKGSIFIECLDSDGEDQQIVIETNGSDGAITVKTNGKINLEAGQAINLKAPEINFDCDKFSVNAQDIQMQSNQVNIDPGEGTIELANGADPEFFFIPSPQSLYFNRGVTTY